LRSVPPGPSMEKIILWLTFPWFSQTKAYPSVPITCCHPSVSFRVIAPLETALQHRPQYLHVSPSRVVYEDGNTEDLFQVMPDEVENFSEADLLGLTREEALKLHEELVYTANLMSEMVVA